MGLEQFPAAKRVSQPANVGPDEELLIARERGIAESSAALGSVASAQASAMRPIARPAVPASIEATGVGHSTLTSLLLKGIHRAGADSAPALAELLRLPGSVIADLLEEAIERKLLKVTGSVREGAIPVLTYSLTHAGQTAAADELDRNSYVGPAPVSLRAYREQAEIQRLHNERVRPAQLREALDDLVLPEELIGRIGPAVSSGRSILFYGPPGNGKSSIARRINRTYADTIYVPYCIEVEGQIVKIFDPRVHEEIEPGRPQIDAGMVIKKDDFDRRWVACRRPVVVTGGEFTIEMLDLHYNETTHFYEAPLHIKALGGVFIIDDFGRQYVRPKDLLNRWMIPLEEKIDYLKLNSGATFSVPFDELVIFCTNMAPESLTDAAFLRRIPYKIRLTSPSPERFREIFVRSASARGLPFDELVFNWLVDELERRQWPLACYQPRFIVDHIADVCAFAAQKPMMTQTLVADALDNLYTGSLEA